MHIFEEIMHIFENIKHIFEEIIEEHVLKNKSLWTREKK